MFVIYSQLVRDLSRLGLQIVMVHSSMRAVGKVFGGPDIVICTFLDVVGESGTVMAYTDWDHAAQHLTRQDAPEPLDESLLEEIPTFDPRTSQARQAYRIFPELLHTWPRACRSSNPRVSRLSHEVIKAVIQKGEIRYKGR